MHTVRGPLAVAGGLVSWLGARESRSRVLDAVRFSSKEPDGNYSSAILSAKNEALLIQNNREKGNALQTALCHHLLTIFYSEVKGLN